MNWRADAACRGMDPDLFFLDTNDWRALAEPKAVCERCSVRDECLLEHIGEMHGIFGGATPHERRALRRSLGIELTRPEAKHGTESRYRHHGCHCEPCLAAHRLAVAKRRDRAARKACA